MGQVRSIEVYQQWGVFGVWNRICKEIECDLMNTLLGTNKSFSQVYSWVDEFPAFPFGGICDPSLKCNFTSPVWHHVFCSITSLLFTPRCALTFQLLRCQFGAMLFFNVWDRFCSTRTQGTKIATEELKGRVLEVPLIWDRGCCCCCCCCCSESWFIVLSTFFVFFCGWSTSIKHWEGEIVMFGEATKKTHDVLCKVVASTGIALILGESLGLAKWIRT